MKITHITGKGFYIHAFEKGKIVITEQADLSHKKEYTQSLIVLPDTIDLAFPIKKISDLTAELFKALLQYEPELIILGTGEKQLFPEASLLKEVYAARIGIEMMNTEAACRTYNILMSDNRKVLAALII